MYILSFQHRPLIVKHIKVRGDLDYMEEARRQRSLIQPGLSVLKGQYYNFTEILDITADKYGTGERVGIINHDKQHLDLPSRTMYEYMEVRNA